MTGDKPMLGTLTRAAEQPQSIRQAVIVDNINTYTYMNIKHTQIRFSSAVLNLDDFMALPWQRVEHTSSVAL